MDTCLAAQDRYKAYLDYFRIEYDLEDRIRDTKKPKNKKFCLWSTA